jgi:hypothetical protein
MNQGQSCPPLRENGDGRQLRIRKDSSWPTSSGIQKKKSETSKSIKSISGRPPGFGKVQFWNANDNRRNYSESRIEALGQVQGRLMVVIFTWRGTVRRIISARKANPREQRRFEAQIRRPSEG